MEGKRILSNKPVALKREFKKTVLILKKGKLYSGFSDVNECQLLRCVVVYSYTSAFSSRG
jgi:hypothetical protein